MTGTELVEEFRKHIAECNRQKPNWIEHSLIGYDPACETIRAAFHTKVSPASLPYIEVKRDSRIETVNGSFRDTLFGNGFRMVTKFYYPDKRFSISTGAMVKATLDVHDDRPSTFSLTVTVSNRDYFKESADVSEICDIHKYLTDFLDSFFPENGIARWKQDLLDKKLADIKDYCNRNRIKIKGKLTFEPGK
jgi:hypothetical protein